ncbi:uncharacterized protein E0L32_011252 [Thyridium curvatum]|uniref:Uncharacterized protein n=1 Tax=Thyridium curvatum TaxID=1093900 RepID=A0A507BP48_9PEZI|nr:uncharacterized protein E0L32_011252 [Thyridium curvatum]TPX19091.1 hypothetical protein E0L32_011252 [Thyridium curvatum]
MPPSISRQGVLSLASTTSASAMRCLSTTRRLQAVNIPPESPQFVKLPQPPQSSEKKYPRVKGRLPVPRDVFHHRTGHLKADPAAFVARAAPVSLAEQRGDTPKSDVEAQRRRLAESRRRSLASGIEGLWQRKQVRERQARDAGRANFNRNRHAALFAPERADDVLTRATVRSSTAKQTAVLPDPDRAARAAASAERTAAIALAKSEARRDALQQLYVAASKFIVDEAELEKTVDKLFSESYFRTQGNLLGNMGAADSVWDTSGAPATVQSMVASLSRTSSKVVDSVQTDADRTRKRQLIIAETLTGGKMQ